MSYKGFLKKILEQLESIDIQNVSTLTDTFILDDTIKDLKILIEEMQ